MLTRTVRRVCQRVRARAPTRRLVRRSGVCAFSSSKRHFSYFGTGGGYLQTGHRVENNEHPRVLVTGAAGQVGSELTKALIEKYGEGNVVASDIKLPASQDHHKRAHFVFLDVLQMDQLSRVVLEYRVDVVVHLASILSAMGERNPQFALRLNTRGIENVLEVARTNELKVFAPSTIAAFGPNSPHVNTPDDCTMRPTTVYGISKVYLELLGEYYHEKYGVDFRSLRYPGVISADTMPGGGTTDYAVEIYHEALREGKYKCFLQDDAEMPMMYIDDAVRASIQLLTADGSKLSRRVYNVTGCSFTPGQCTESIKRIIPDFDVSYCPDFRQDIADSWPKSLDDSAARKDWGWKHELGLDEMTAVMFDRLAPKYGYDFDPHTNSLTKRFN